MTRQVMLYRYRLPMQPGVVLGNQRFTEREGFLFALDEAGRRGVGEIAPLPGFSRESLADASAAALRWTTGRISEEMLAAAPPSVGFGISCALAELTEVLPLQADYISVPLYTEDPYRTLACLMTKPPAQVAKIKVGLNEPIRDSLTINMLLSALPNLHLRLDANRRWTRERALQFACYLEEDYQSRIDFLEEPCNCPADSLIFAAKTGIPIAWDESAREPGFALKAAFGLVALIIKPSLTGTLARCRQILDRAQELGLTAVISSGVESSLALTQLSRLAKWLTPAVTPGLDTLSLMQAQLVRPWPGCNLPLISWSQLEPNMS